MPLNHIRDSKVQIRGEFFVLVEPSAILVLLGLHVNQFMTINTNDKRLVEPMVKAVLIVPDEVPWRKAVIFNRFTAPFFSHLTEQSARHGFAHVHLSRAAVPLEVASARLSSTTAKIPISVPIGDVERNAHSWKISPWLHGLNSGKDSFFLELFVEHRLVFVSERHNAFKKFVVILRGWIATPGG